MKGLKKAEQQAVIDCYRKLGIPDSESVTIKTDVEAGEEKKPKKNNLRKLERLMKRFQ